MNRLLSTTITLVFVIALLSCNTTPVPASATLPANPPRAATPAETAASPNLLADNPNPPATPVKLVFIHHSTGGNWLADSDFTDVGGDLGKTLMNNNYYVSATNYGWGPDGIGNMTDLGHWWTWFRDDNSAAYTAALYTEYDQNLGGYGPWERMAVDPGGENKIILFKSCYPNSALGGSPSDAPTVGDNPMRGAWAGDPSYTVANAKGIYNDLLVYFATRQDKLFIVITAPPLMQSATNSTQAANARAFNTWLVNDWLDAYPYNNVAVFDFYNVLTSNGGNEDTNDLGSATGNHHRWWNSAVQHLQTVSNNYLSYPTGDSHPNYAGNQKATAEFVTLLNVYYNRWAGSTPPTPSLKIFMPVVRR